MHIIQKHIVEVELPASEDAFFWQDALVRLCEDKVTQILDELLTEADDKNRLIEINRIEIELKDIKINDFENQFIEALKAAIKLELNDKVAISKGTEATPKSESIQFLESDLKVFLYFLQNGTFPWWTSVQNVNQLEERILIFLQKQTPSFLRRTFSDLLTNQSTMRRFIWQLSADFQSQFLDLFNKNHPVIQRIFQDIFTEILQVIRKESYSPTEVIEIIKIEVISGIIQYENLNFQDILIKIIQKTGLSNHYQAESNGLNFEHSLDDLVNIIHKKTQSIESVFWNLNIELLKEQLYSIKTETSQEEKPANPPNDLEENNDGIYINNAGLVLLSPFLSEYLKACNVVQNNEITDTSLAVHAIQYLATGNENTPENELILNKVLCGLSIEQAVALEVTLSEEIKAEAKKMLEAVIFYWDVLQDTSVDGLRYSFLQRQGKLSKKEDGDWLLQVEQQSYDMLLGHLPWTYSIIKLPTMNTTLWVEWA